MASTLNFVLGPFGINLMEFAKAGDFVRGHDHNFAHLTYVNRGVLRFETLELISEARGPDDPAVFKTIAEAVVKATDNYNMKLINAKVFHRITALEDNSSGHCLYVHRDPLGTVVDEYQGWGPAYV